jgi:hypothetical protein
LRDEFAMVDDVFALSPISARPAQPSEADYEAIRDAFMETSRGRWFLGEYAKRNRNADTSMVLDAVARIEQALAAQQRLQQQEMQEAQEAQQAEANALPEVLAAIRHAVAGAEGAAAAVLDGLALEQNLAPVRKGIRIIKEISWRWREIGADSRICDLIDSQVMAIEAACDQIAGADPRPALIAAFEMLKAQLDGFAPAEAAIPPAAEESAALAAETTQPVEASAPETSAASTAAEAIVPDAPAQPTEASAAAEPAVETGPSPANSVLSATPVESGAEATSSPAPRALEPAMEPAARASEPVRQTEIPVEPAPVFGAATAPPQAVGGRSEVADQVAASPADDSDLDIVVVTKAEADAHDEAILELVAAEMSAPDPVDEKDYIPSSSIHFDIEEPVSVDDDIVATFAETPAPEPATTVTAVAVPPAPELTPAAAMAPASAVPPAPQAAPVPPAPAPEPRLAVVPMPELPIAPPVAREPTTPSPAVQEARPAATLHPLPKPLPQPSLGSTLLASGMLQRPIAANDPLTPIRRMTQPEKIAFFS